VVVQGQSGSARLLREAPDLRRAIPRQTWLANRAGNALRRPAFILAIGIGTFVTAIVSLVVVFNAQRQPPPPIPMAVRPDTLPIAAAIASSRVQLAQAESALVATRAEASAAAGPQRTDTLVRMEVTASRDSLSARLAGLEARLTRAEQAPLFSSYKALADHPELQSDARVRALLDTLSDIEREREGFGAVGGVDPIFVALTSRASEVGRALQSIARERRNGLLTQLGGVVPAEAEPESPPAPVIDTLTHLVARDSLRRDIQERAVELSKRRSLAQGMDREEERARQRANEVAPPLALLASAFVLSWAFGFAVAFVGELRTPRVSNENELERFLGVRVLSSVNTPMPSADRGRREADRAAPPYVDPGIEGYQLAYLGLALDQPTLLVATVTGDDPAIAAVVACNLAAVAADEARTTLVVDLERSGSASAVLRTRVAPGVADMIVGERGWPDATTVARIGRDKTVDLVPRGSGTQELAASELIGLLKRDCPRLARYYDAILLHAAATDVTQGLAGALPSPEVIYCAQPGITPLRQLRGQLDLIRAAGGSIRGIVLWEAERPLLPTLKELAVARRRDLKSAHEVVAVP
jgi:Mrp family chromosome partitioning ATPase